jgi:hypothetical protein
MIRRTIGLLAIACITTTAFAYLCNRRNPAAKKVPPYNSNILKSKTAALKKYAAANGYDTGVCFMVDMAAAPGSKRFFVYNLTKDSIEGSGLVAHGSGSDRDGGATVFSNKPGSLCTSLGRYKIGTSYNGQFGLAYKLYGLDAANNKAFERFVVLHAHACVPDGEVKPQLICVSWGCPTVAPAFLQKLAGYINKAGKPVLLEIYSGK